MLVLKNYVGSVYGGLGHLLLDYYQLKQLEVPEKLLAIQNLERFDFALWRDLLTTLDQQLQRPALGLEIAQLVEAKHLGIIGYLALSSETLGEAFMRYHDYHRLIYDGGPLQLQWQGDYLSIGWVEVPFHLNTQLTDEIAIALMTEFVKANVQNPHGVQLYEVHFQHVMPKNIALYEQYFGCKVRFSQARNQVLMHVSELSRPLKQGDQTLQKLLMQQAKALLEKFPYSTLVDQQLQQAILIGLQKNLFQIKHIAEQMNFSVRQLQRHLQKQGKTYQQCMQEIRCMLAMQYLKDPHLSLQETAMLLGYSEQSAFQRAFKQWTQLTPQQWRQQNMPAA
ncbi:MULTISPECIES: AraC family transcriptional regulator [Acinetobacter]|uniref:AraC family transcriptional regulator n=1 Tax=Acinetobacter TaxID=469 RepID=UPI001448B1E4|nr:MULTISPECIES: AraC family transcriptional regulator ligand-binding domain-containing protein [Acinetobacter]MCU4421771.1 AraC family transcriptional regulator [Acinetobacter lwoffii]MDT0198895.1 AraC family transcriptional regulator ligand-binding domain-containing protein [Acinetobacter sp. RG5]MDT0230537.1 AraC family transcriptional regulator ligand-binding domain-containing protein [Acinetobacter sp. RRD8]QJB47516.1 AraC family transcriptional regulator [Acinetobacter sp. NEB149]